MKSFNFVQFKSVASLQEAQDSKDYFKVFTKQNITLQLFEQLKKIIFI